LTIEDFVTVSPHEAPHAERAGLTSLKRQRSKPARGSPSLALQAGVTRSLAKICVVRLNVTKFQISNRQFPIPARLTGGLRRF
jgi:hypothetical protein